MAQTRGKAPTVVGIDTGGTFTDFLLVDGGGLRVHKVPSTPGDPSRAIIQGLEEVGIGGRDAAVVFVHGSTVATNALLERKGATTALVTTEGVEDLLEIGRQARPRLYDLTQQLQDPLVPRHLRFGARERICADGSVLTPLTRDQARRIAERVGASGAQAVAVSLLFSFLDPAHEGLLEEELSKLDPTPFLSVSSRVLPQYREYERTSTVAVNAYVGPLMSSYLGRLEEALGGQPKVVPKGKVAASRIRVMQSSGGSISARAASAQPVRTILSGPAGGVVGAFALASEAGCTDIITLDMGGTSTDVALCPGRIQETASASVGGVPVGVPMIDIHTVGAGGGSIARVDAGGALLVGPESSGADPGPACYGRGEEATVTDANLLLGRMDAGHFLGGRMGLEPERARAALGRIASAIGGVSPEEAAAGVIRVVNAAMERALRAISLERGFDPRRFTLVAFGGAGPQHACELAQELHIPRVLVPAFPGALSAYGVAIADVVKDYLRTVLLAPGGPNARGTGRGILRHGGAGQAGDRRGGCGAKPGTAAPAPGHALRRPVIRADRGLPEDHRQQSGGAGDRAPLPSGTSAPLWVLGREPTRGGGECPPQGGRKGTDAGRREAGGGRWERGDEGRRAGGHARRRIRWDEAHRGLLPAARVEGRPAGAGTCGAAAGGRHDSCPAELGCPRGRLGQPGLGRREGLRRHGPRELRILHGVKTLDATDGPRTRWGLLFRAWAVLVESARARRTITYGELANRIMLPGDVRSIGPMVLHPVYVHFCAPNGFPDILSLVVRKDTGRPGIGYYSGGGGTEDVARWRSELEETYAFQWPAEPPGALWANCLREEAAPGRPDGDGTEA